MVACCRSPLLGAISTEAAAPPVLQACYSTRSDRRLIAQRNDNPVTRVFVGLLMDAPVWDASTFTKNRERFLDKNGNVTPRPLVVILDQPRLSALM